MTLPLIHQLSGDIFLKTRVIVSATERKTYPWLSFIMSLAIPGLGEFYAGVGLSGIIFSLSRLIAVLAIPFYSFINSFESMTEEILAVIVLFFLITILSAFHAFYRCRKEKAILSWYSSPLFYSFFSSVNILFTVISMVFFFSFFEITKTDEAHPPLFRKGDIIVIKKFIPSGYNRGDVVAVKSGAAEKILRVIGLPGERIEYRKGRFLSEGSELPLSIFTEEELRKLSLTDYDVISEHNGKVRYAVKRNPALSIPEIQLSDSEYYLAPDIRNQPELFIKAEPAMIKGRIEGILFSGEAGILPCGTSLPSDNFISASQLK